MDRSIRKTSCVCNCCPCCMNLSEIFEMIIIEWNTCICRMLYINTYMRGLEANSPLLIKKVWEGQTLWCVLINIHTLTHWNPSLLFSYLFFHLFPLWLLSFPSVSFRPSPLWSNSFWCSSVLSVEVRILWGGIWGWIYRKANLHHLYQTVQNQSLSSGKTCIYHMTQCIPFPRP